MHIKILTLTILLLLVTVATVTTTNNNNNLEPVPGIGLLQNAINMKYGPFAEPPTDPIFEMYSYNEGYSIYSNGQEYAVPNQMYVNDWPTLSEKSTTYLFYSASSVQSSMFESFTTGFSCKRFACMFQFSEQVSTFNYAYEMQDSYTGLTYLITTSTYAERTNYTLNNKFTTIASKLPTTYNETTCRPFIDFINMFGTNYVNAGYLGGYIFMDSEYKTSLTYEMSEEDIEIGIKTQFVIFSGATHLQFNETKIEKQLDLVFNSTIYVLGGNPSAFVPGQYQGWLATVPSDPVIVRADIINIGYLLYGTDQYTAVINAVEDYLSDGSIYMNCN